MDQSRYLELIGIERWRLRANTKTKPQYDAQLTDSLAQKEGVNVAPEAEIPPIVENSKHHPCPLCIDSTNPNYFVVSESTKGRWYWLVQGEITPLIDDIIKASQTERRDGNKQLSCVEIAETCSDKLNARMGSDDVLLIVGLKAARLILQQAKPFDFEAKLGEQAERLWQFEGNQTVVLPSLRSMQDDRRNKKQAWLNIQQAMRS